MQNLQFFFSLSKRLFLGLYELDILACEPVNAVVLDILSDGRLSQLKQLSFVGKSLYESYNLTSMFESLFASHPKLVFIGFRKTIVSYPWKC